MQTFVTLPCNKDRVRADKVEFLDIEEGPQGEDRLTYKCPACGEQHTSIVYGERVMLIDIPPDLATTIEQLLERRATRNKTQASTKDFKTFRAAYIQGQKALTKKIYEASVRLHGRE